jgi:hypothetical protein
MLEYRIEEEGPVYTENWLLDDVPHREDGPAIVMRRMRDGAVAFELWYAHGRLHRGHGPAALLYDPDSGRVTQAHYFLDGRPAREDAGPQSLDFDKDSGRLTSAHWLDEDAEPMRLTLSRWLWLTRARASES